MRTQSLLLGCVLALGLVLVGWALGWVRLDAPTPAPSDGVRPGLLGDRTPSSSASAASQEPLCPAASLEGTLAFDEHAGLGIVDTGGTFTPVDWPPAWSSAVRGGAVELLDESGAVVARTGESVVVGGGFGATGTSFRVCPATVAHPAPTR